MNYIDNEFGEAQRLLSLSEYDLLDLISDNVPDSSKFVFIPLKSIGSVNCGTFNGVGLIPFIFVENCRTLFKTKHQRVKEWLDHKYSPYKKAVCHIPFVKQFSKSQVLEIEVILEIAKELAEKSGDALKFTIIVAAYIAKAGLENYCRSEWR